MVYFTSDFHFSHEAVILFERNQFDKTSDHDKAVLESLSVLTKEDEIWFLGDMGWPNDFVSEKIRKMECHKYMIKGNHDTDSNYYYIEKFGLKECYDHPVWLNDRIVLSHYPVPVENGVLNIHGHLHGSVIDRKNYINANVHIQDYKLIPMTTIEKMLKKLNAPSKDYLKEWFADIQRPYKSDFRIDRILWTDGTIAGTKPYHYDNNSKIVIDHKRLSPSSKKAADINKRLIGKTINSSKGQYRILNSTYKGFETTGPFIYYDDNFKIKK